MTEEKKPVFWGLKDQERYHHTDMGDAIYEILDAKWPNLPDTLTLVGMSPQKVSGHPVDPDRLVEMVLETLDEEFGDPEEYSEPTPMMKVAAEVFVAAVVDEYKVWTCEKVTEETVDVKAWCATHEPDLLKTEAEVKDGC